MHTLSGKLQPLGSAVGVEDLLDSPVEQLGDPERQRQARIVLAPLQGIHRLTRDAELLGQIALRPIALRPQNSKHVFH